MCVKGWELKNCESSKSHLISSAIVNKPPKSKFENGSLLE
jgi:hypothetical protein